MKGDKELELWEKIADAKDKNRLKFWLLMVYQFIRVCIEDIIEKIRRL